MVSLLRLFVLIFTRKISRNYNISRNQYELFRITRKVSRYYEKVSRYYVNLFRNYEKNIPPLLLIMSPIDFRRRDTRAANEETKNKQKLPNYFFNGWGIC